MQAAEQVALHGTAVYGLPYPLLFVLIPHGIFQYFFEHTLHLHFLCAHVAEVGTEIAAVGAPVLLLPADVARRAVNQLIETRGILDPFVDGIFILKRPVKFPGCFSACNAVRTKTICIGNGIKRTVINNMRLLPAAFTYNALLGGFENSGLQRVRVVTEKRELCLRFALPLRYCPRFRAFDRKGIAPILRLILEAPETL